ncbi:ABC transporter permease [Candidatus Bipolaricaulota bacterium]|nr:ABC transporter permease [Candidatus Bipolaricaulota bacterium]MBS3814392.1 ABC transporter permease [Candidatus Bipolaricaulota bacterium]
MVDSSPNLAPSLWERVKSGFSYLIRLRDKPLGFAGLVIILFWIAISILAPYITPYGPTDFSTDKFVGPSLQHPFGTDRWGRDVFTRVVAGSRTAFSLALSATFLGLVGGTTLGLSAAYFGGWIEEVLGRLMDILMSFPALLIAMFVLGVLGPGTINVIIVIGIAHTPRIGRVARSATLQVKNQEFVEAARVRGESDLYIMGAEILPNILDTLGVEAAIRFAYSIFLSASLGFLGLGVQPPTPDWGLMISESRSYLQVAPWLAIFPALAIASMVLGANFLAEGLEEVTGGGQ